jgi:hypothetical protein
LSGFGAYKSLEKFNHVLSENQSSPEAPIGFGRFQSAPLKNNHVSDFNQVRLDSITGLDLIRKPDQIR